MSQNAAEAVVFLPSIESSISPAFTRSTPNSESKKTSLFRKHAKFILICIVILSLLLLAFLLLNNATTTIKPAICQTKSCILAGKSLFSSINFTANPCDNFYKYACGGWIALNPIPDDKLFINTFSLIQENVTNSLKSLLEQKKPKVPETIPKSVQFTLNLYNECMDASSRESLGLVPMKDQLTQRLGTSWPILNSTNSTSDPKNLKKLMETIFSFQEIDSSSIISLFFDIDLNKTDTKIIYFGVPEFGLGRTEYTDQSGYNASIVYYRKYMLEIAKLFAGSNVEAKNLQARLDEIFELEQSLVLATQPPELSKNPKFWYNKMSLGDFQNITSNRVDWSILPQLYMNRFNLTYDFSNSSQVIVQDLAYFQKLSQLLVDTPFHVFYNYFGFRFIAEYSNAANSQLQAINLDYARAQTRDSLETPLWEKCLETVKSYLDMAVSRLYVDHLVVPGTKKRAEEMIADLKAAFYHIVENETPWLDEITKGRTLEKAARTQFKVAYPEWIRNDAYLDDYYGFDDGDGQASFTIKKGRYLETLLDFKQLRNIKDVHKTLNLTTNWRIAPAEVNAYAETVSNSIILPAGILHSPFFDPGRPAYLNYGAIGSIIGHEITHHFDGEGRMYDKAGNQINWWTDKTEKHFEQASKCFVEQYGAIVDEVTGEKLNGRTTVSENIADNGGLREAYFAFKSLSTKVPLELVPQMDTFTIEQLFFLAYANVWCSNQMPENLAYEIDVDEHAPKMYRVNVPLGNFEQFAEAFNCPKGSKMNPVKRCFLW